MIAAAAAPSKNTQDKINDRTQQQRRTRLERVGMEWNGNEMTRETREGDG